MKYLEQMKEDILEHIKNEGITIAGKDPDELYETLYDELWVDDSVTGNGSGSYTFNREKAKEYVLGDGIQYFGQLVMDYGINAETILDHVISQDWEWLDVSIRCCLLGQAIGNALEDVR